MINGVTILVGDVLERLREIPDDSVHCIVTSPPYWGLRDYGVDGQGGLEPTIGDHIAWIVEVFEELRRVLRADGVCWLNYGDAYGSAPNGRAAKDIPGDDRGFVDKPFSTIGGPIKTKDMCLLPERILIALQDAGWYVRDKVIWNKPNPMPSSVKDRCAPAWEPVYMLTKSARYWSDFVAIREETVSANDSRSAFEKGTFGQDKAARMPVVGGYPVEGPHNNISASHTKKNSFKRKNSARADGLQPGNTGSHRPERDDKEYGSDGTRNARNIWTIATKPCSEAHFATFPPELPERCIKASVPHKCCAVCGTGYVRVTESTLVPTPKACKTGIVDSRDAVADRQDAGSNRQKDGHIPGMAKAVDTVGWQKNCKCETTDTVPGTVLDPFIGAGTTGLVAHQLGRQAIGVELNPEYVEIAKRRIDGNTPMFPIVTVDSECLVEAAE